MGNRFMRAIQSRGFVTCWEHLQGISSQQALYPTKMHFMHRRDTTSTDKLSNAYFRTHALVKQRSRCCRRLRPWKINVSRSNTKNRTTCSCSYFRSEIAVCAKFISKITRIKLHITQPNSKSVNVLYKRFSFITT